MNMCPNNTVANFKTNLYKTIELSGKWEVALAEIVFPLSFCNVTKGQNLIQYHDTQIENLTVISWGHVRISPGYYAMPNRLINHINEQIESINGETILKYNEMTGLVDVKTTGKYNFIFDNGLAQTLGFEPELSIP